MPLEPWNRRGEAAALRYDARMRVLALVIATLLSSSTAANDRAWRLLDQWIVMVDRHTPGEDDDAIAELSKWSLGDLDLMQAYVDAVTGVPLDTTSRSRRRRALSGQMGTIRKISEDLKLRGDFDRFRKRAALLHTDAALFESFEMKVRQPLLTTRAHDRYTRRVDVLSLDGQVQQFQLADPHWDYARDLLDSLPTKPQPDPLVAEWYRAIGAHFVLHRSFAEAHEHFKSVPASVAKDPLVSFGAATLQEVLGAPRVQDYVHVAMQNGVMIAGISSSSTHFQRAIGLLRDALAAKPDFTEARLRLGRLLCEQKEYEEALTHLRQAIGSRPRKPLLYYAHIFSGDALMGLGRAADARDEYKHALDAYPDAQAARFGFAAALRMLGERQTAIDAVMATITVPPDARDVADEPWWNYYDGDEAGVDQLLANLRAPFRERRP